MMVLLSVLLFIPPVVCLCTANMQTEQQRESKAAIRCLSLPSVSAFGRESMSEHAAELWPAQIHI